MKLRRATRFVFAFSSISTTHSRSSWGFCKLLYCCGGILISKKGRLRNCSLVEILVVVAQRRDITISCFQSVLITSSKFCRRIHPKLYMRTRFAIITTAIDSSTQDCRLYLLQAEVSLSSCILCDQLTSSWSFLCIVMDILRCALPLSLRFMKWFGSIFCRTDEIFSFGRRNPSMRWANDSSAVLDSITAYKKHIRENW